MADTFRGEPDSDANFIDMRKLANSLLAGPKHAPFYDRFSAATRRAHARAIRELEADANPILDMSEADLAELTAQAIDTPRAQADIAIGIRPAPLASDPYELRCPAQNVEPMYEIASAPGLPEIWLPESPPRPYPPQQVERETDDVVGRLLRGELLDTDGKDSERWDGQ